MLSLQRFVSGPHNQLQINAAYLFHRLKFIFTCLHEKIKQPSQTYGKVVGFLHCARILHPTCSSTNADTSFQHHTYTVNHLSTHLLASEPLRAHQSSQTAHPQCWMIHRVFSLDHSSRGTAPLIFHAYIGKYITVIDRHYILHLLNQLVHMLRQNSKTTQTQRSTTLSTVDWTAR